jgi:hypothetical protein
MLGRRHSHARQRAAGAHCGGDSRISARGRQCAAARRLQAENGCECRIPRFAGCAFLSTREQGRGRHEWLLCKLFGPLKTGTALVLGKGACIDLRRWEPCSGYRFHSRSRRAMSRSVIGDRPDRRVPGLAGGAPMRDRE